MCNCKSFHIQVIISIGKAPHRIIPAQVEVNSGDSADFNCISELPPGRKNRQVTWLFNSYYPINGIAEPKGFHSLHIKSVNMKHSGHYTCYGWKRSLRFWIRFIATANLHVLGKTITIIIVYPTKQLVGQFRHYDEVMVNYVENMTSKGHVKHLK